MIANVSKYVDSPDLPTWLEAHIDAVEDVDIRIGSQNTTVIVSFRVPTAELPVSLANGAAATVDD